MRILVTGVMGFIGSHFARYELTGNDDYIIGVDRMGDIKSQLRVKDCLIYPKFNLIYADLTNQDAISGILEGIDIVVNFAANTFVDHSVVDPRPFVNSNILGTFNLLEQARKYRVKKFIHISTDEVYGQAMGRDFLETDMLNPTNPYSATKAAADMLCLAYHKTFGIPIIILRCENNYGKRQHPQKAIPTFIRHAMANKKIPLYGDGKHKRRWLRVEDFCEAIAMAIMFGEVGEIYNVGSNEEIENETLATRILDILGKKNDLIEMVPDHAIRPYHDRQYAVDTAKILKLDWKPKHNLKDGLEEIVRWYKDNDFWLQ